MIKKEKTKALTTRFSMKDYLLMQERAEKQRCAIADVVRDACSKMERDEIFQTRLSRSEQRLRIDVFLMLCEVVGLSDDERADCVQSLESKKVRLS